MDDRTGELYSTMAAALAAGVPEEHVVEIRGDERAVQNVSSAVKLARRHESFVRKSQNRRRQVPRRTGRRKY